MTSYTHFIRQFLVHRAYALLIEIESHVQTLEDSISTKVRGILRNQLHDLFQYYVEVFPLIENTTSVSYEEYLESSVPSFQEYVDERFSLETMGSHDYQQFIKNMQDTVFYSRVFGKYQDHFYQEYLADGVIALVELLCKSAVLTDSEKDHLEKALGFAFDLVPYFEYISASGSARSEREERVWALINQSLFTV